MRSKAILIVLVGLVFASTSGLAVQTGLRLGAQPSTLAFYRLVFVSLLLAPIYLKKDSRSQLRALSPRDWALVALTGAMLALHFYGWMAGLQIAGTAAAASLLNLQPLMVVALSTFALKERTPPRALVWAVPAIGGAILISGGVGLEGAVWPIMSALGYAVYIVCMRGLRSKLGAGASMQLTGVVCAVVLAVPLAIEDAAAVSVPILGVSLYMAVACSLCGHMLFSWALKHLPASAVSTLLLIEPVPAALWTFLLIGEVPGGAVVIGSAVMLAGAVAFTLTQARYGGTKDEFVEQIEVTHISMRPLTFVVIDASLDGRRVFVRHKKRETWELPGGHIEPGEMPDEAASRELYEETGIRGANLTPLADYGVRWKGSASQSWGRLYSASGGTRDPLPASEIAEARVFTLTPLLLTYPRIQQRLMHVQKIRRARATEWPRR